MKNFNIGEKKAIHDEIDLDVQYFQAVIVWGSPRSYLTAQLSRFKLHFFPKRLYPDALALIGAGSCFPPFIRGEVDCRCMDVCSRVIVGYKPFDKACDLRSIVEFLKLGGAGYGYPTSCV